MESQPKPMLTKTGIGASLSCKSRGLIHEKYFLDELVIVKYIISSDLFNWWYVDQCKDMMEADFNSFLINLTDYVAEKAKCAIFQSWMQHKITIVHHSSSSIDNRNFKIRHWTADRILPDPDKTILYLFPRHTLQGDPSIWRLFCEW